jgi:hypothetical protein
VFLGLIFTRKGNEMAIAKAVVEFGASGQFLRDRDGFPVVEFNRIPEGVEEFLPPDWQAAVIGWGNKLLASHSDLTTLAQWVQDHFQGKVRIAHGSENPLGWAVANW